MVTLFVHLYHYLLSCQNDDILYDLIIDAAGQQVVVAQAKILGDVQGQMLHNVPLGSDKVKVSISVPLIPYAAIPFPLEEIWNVEQAVGTYIAWPRQHVRKPSKV